MKPSIAIDTLDRAFDEGRIWDVARANNIAIPTYEEAYTPGHHIDEIDHLRSCDRDCLCPICESEKMAIESGLYIRLRRAIESDQLCRAAGAIS